MLSFASAAYMADKTLVDTYHANLEMLPDASSDPETMRWWEAHPDAWHSNRTNSREPEMVMQEYASWVKGLPGTPVFVAYPAAFDFMFVYWYLIRFTGESPFAHSALDMKTLAMSLLGLEYLDSTKGNMPNEWFEPLSHTHIALDDAIEQGSLFCNMLQELKSRDRGSAA
jgi:DNA polymerase III alpha subunit (gram-positive type)